MNRIFLLKFYHYFVLATIFLFSILFFPSNFAQAAQLFVNPLEPTVEVGDLVKFRVGVNSGGVSVNNSESQIRFPNDLIQVIGIDTSSSVFDLWVEQPTFLNSSGTISFNGGKTNPGFNGTNGTLFWITARALKPGNAEILLQSSFIRANDGLGTNVLTSVRNTSVAIIVAPVVIPPPAEIVSEIEGAEVEIVLQEDSTGPKELFILITKNEEGNFIAIFEAYHDHAIDYFSVLLGDRNPVHLEAINNSATYAFPLGLENGSHTLVVTAFDQAGNSITKTEKIFFENELLTILNYPRVIVVGEKAFISAETGLPNEEVVVVVVYPSRRIETYLVKTDAHGDFDFQTESLDQIGDYILWVQRNNINGVDLSVSERIYISVGQTWFQDQIDLIEHYTPFIIGFVLLLLLIIVIMRIFGYQVVRFSRNKND